MSQVLATCAVVIYFVTDVCFVLMARAFFQEDRPEWGYWRRVLTSCLAGLLWPIILMVITYGVIRQQVRKS